MSHKNTGPKEDVRRGGGSMSKAFRRDKSSSWLLSESYYQKKGECIQDGKGDNCILDYGT